MWTGWSAATCRSLSIFHSNFHPSLFIFGNIEEFKKKRCRNTWRSCTSEDVVPREDQDVYESTFLYIRCTTWGRLTPSLCSGYAIQHYLKCNKSIRIDPGGEERRELAGDLDTDSDADSGVDPVDLILKMTTANTTASKATPPTVPPTIVPVCVPGSGGDVAVNDRYAFDWYRLLSFVTFLN